MSGENPFEHIRARWMLALLAATYLAATLAATSLHVPGAPWYWGEMLFFYVWHASLALGMWCAAERAGLDILRFMAWDLDGRRLASLAGATVMIYLASLALLWLLFLPLVPVAPDFVRWWVIEEPDIVYASGDALPFWPNVLGFVDVVVIVPVVEEIFFRGFLLQRLALKWSTGAAIAASTALFALLHVDPLGSALFGFAMCVFYMETGSLLAPVLCHGLTNAIAWSVSLAERHVRGFDHVYSLQEFAGEWWLGAAAGIVSARWVVRFVATHRHVHRRPAPRLS